MSTRTRTFQCCTNSINNNSNNSLTINQQQEDEEEEEEIGSRPFACLSVHSRDRGVLEEECPVNSSHSFNNSTDPIQFIANT